ncbi:UTP--glucose-1-phosphate uridylyltransferase, partial [Bacillus licheniformis]
YILTPKIFDLLAVQERGVGNEIQLTDALQTMLKYENVYAQIFEGKSYDIGEKLGYLKTIIEFAVEREDLKEDLVQFMKNILSKTD